MTTKLQGTASELLVEVEAFLAQPAPRMRPPRRLIDRYIGILAIETFDDARIADALRFGEFNIGERIRRSARRRHDAGRALDTLADSTEALERHYDELPHWPSLGALRRPR